MSPQQPHRHRGQGDADQVREVGRGHQPDRVAFEQADDGARRSEEDGDNWCIGLRMAVADGSWQQAVLGQLRQGPRCARQRLDGAAEHVDHDEPDAHRLGQGTKQRGVGRAQCGGQVSLDRIAECGGAEHAQPHDGHDHEVDAGHPAADPHGPGLVAVGVLHLPDMAGRRLEGRGGETDQVETGHGAGEAAE